VLPDVPVEVFVNTTDDPIQIDRGVPSKFASSEQPCKLIASVLGAPIQFDAFVSVTVMLPFVVPKFTVILLVP
jgi:hypothetical protein